jgi:cytochrome P450
MASVTFLRDPIGTISENMRKFSGTYSGYLMGIGRFIITEDPDFIEYVLRENHTNFQKSALSTETAARLFGKGLLFSNGEYWLKQRRLIQPAFHQGKIQGLYGIIASTASSFISGFPAEGEVDIYPLMHKLSFSVLIHSLFDINLSEQTIDQLSRGFTDLQDYLLKDINQPFRKIFYPLNKADRNILQKSLNIRSAVKDIIEQRRSGRESHHDLLDMLMNSVYDDSMEGMTETQLIDEILVLLFAGHETTANSLSWLLYLIAGHPEVAKKLKSVIAEIPISESPRNAYINAVISEGMRLYPAAWMTERVALNDDCFGTYFIPKGTIIIPFFYGLHRNKKYWNDESEFHPERFIAEDPTKNKKLKNFFPFGAGPRMCIGNNFAVAEMAFVLYLFMGSYDISRTDAVPKMWPLITLRPHNLLLQVKRTINKDYPV